MKKIALGIAAAVIGLGGFFWGSVQPSLAQGKSFGNVFPFISASGRVCFFDQAKGKLYIYDNDMKTCLFIGEIEELGEPIKTVKDESNPPEKNLEYRPNK